jgi:hypothetical protein
MNKASWVSKIVRIGALGLGSLAFVAALASANNLPPDTAVQATPGSQAVTCAAEPQSANGPASATCQAIDGTTCSREGAVIHCADTTNGIVGRCECFEGSWTCVP